MKKEKDSIQNMLDEIITEVEWAIGHYPRFNSIHEAYAILLEEVDELWDEVKVKQSCPKRKERVRKEAVQVAAMAIRLLNDCCRRD